MRFEDDGSDGLDAGATHDSDVLSTLSVNRIILRIQSEDLDSRLEAAKEIRLLTKTSQRYRRFFSPAVEHLVDLLRCSSDAANEVALAACLNLAVQDEMNKRNIVTAGALKPVIGFLASENLALQGNAVALLITLSASSTNKAIIGASGVFPPLLQILTDPATSSQAKFDSLMALHNLSSHKENLVKLLEAEPVPALILLLKSSRRASKIAGKCTSLIEILMEYEEARSALVSEDGGILAVVEVLESGSVENGEHAVGALLAMCRGDRSKYREPILREGVIPGLLEFTVQGTPKSQYSARVLLRLLRDTPRSSSDVQQPDTFENIVCNIISQIDDGNNGEEDGCGKSKKMVSDMVQLSMELSLKRMQDRASVLTEESL